MAYLGAATMILMGRLRAAFLNLVSQVRILLGAPMRLGLRERRRGRSMGQSRMLISAEVTMADVPTPSTVRMVFQVPGTGKR